MFDDFRHEIKFLGSLAKEEFGRISSFFSSLRVLLVSIISVVLSFTSAGSIRETVSSLLIIESLKSSDCALSPRSLCV